MQGWFSFYRGLRSIGRVGVLVGPCWSGCMACGGTHGKGGMSFKFWCAGGRCMILLMCLCGVVVDP